MTLASSAAPVSGRLRLRAELAIAVTAFKQRIAYRVYWMFGLMLGGIELLTALALWGTVLAERGEIAGYDWPAMRTYYIIGFITSAFVFGGAEMRQAARVLDGLVSIDLLKPIDFQRARAAEYCGTLGAQLITIAVGGTAATLLFSPLPPASLAAGLLFTLSVALIAPLVANVAFLTIMLCFWTRSYHGVMWARQTITAFFSGMLVPLAFMPEPLQALAWALPFVHFTTTPSSIYLGRVDALGALGLIAAQVAWIAVLWFLGRLLWRGAVRIVTIHGG